LTGHQQFFSVYKIILTIIHSDYSWWVIGLPTEISYSPEI